MIDMNRQTPDEMPMDSNHPVITHAVVNLRAMIEADVKILTQKIGRDLNERENNALVEKAIKAVCGTLTRVEGRVLLTLMGARAD